MLHVQGLEALGVTSEQYGSLLIPVIMAKFPNDIRLRIAQETGREAWKIDAILKIVKEEVEAREASEGAGISANKAPFQSSRNSSLTPQQVLYSLVTTNRNVFTVRVNISLPPVSRLQPSMTERTSY